ncbi:MAG: hypothetical protein ACJ798_07080 [Phenylobacterium sp.]
MRTNLPAVLLPGALVVLALAGSTAAEAGVAANGAPLKVAATLTCPATEGMLTRLRQAPDGQSCDYQGRDGDTVRLSLAALNGRAPSEAMAPLRAELHALVPVYRVPTPVSYSDEPGDRADVDLPFLHVHAVGDRADVRLFGIHISSRGQNADVDVSRGHKRSVVHAGARGAEVVAEDVGRSNASLVYVLAANHRASSGYRAVGYVAKGPVTGPLVVAEFHSVHDRHGAGDGDHGDIDRLIDRNVRD